MSKDPLVQPGKHWRAVATESWGKVTLTGAIVVWLAAISVLAQASFGDRWVPILDHANLLFHEAGHPILGLVSSRLAVYGGTLGQLAFPLITTMLFWKRREPIGFGLCALGTCQNRRNIATYMGDARAMALPLIGGLDPEVAHDWREILSRWDLLEWDGFLAILLTLLAWFAATALGGWILARWRVHESSAN